MVFNATFTNISIISWRSIYFGGRNWITRRKPAESHWQPIMFYRVHLTMCSIHTHYFNNGDRHPIALEVVNQTTIQ